MLAPSIPSNENERMQCLKELNILETPVDETFEKITRITKALFKVPIVAISLVDNERQWFKSIQGLSVCETSREISFCGHAILQDELFLVNDAREDERFSDNPLVVNEPFIKFYAGYPIKSKKGNNVGTLCIIDQKPRNFNIRELEPLKDMASLLENELYTYKQSHAQKELLSELHELKKKSMVDPLTRLWNKAAIEDLLFKQLLSCCVKELGFSVCFFDLDNFKSINDNFGHLAGDEVLRCVGKCLLNSIRATDLVGRWGGEEFLMMIDTPDLKKAQNITERARANIENLNINFQGNKIHTTVTGGLVFIENPNLNEPISSLLDKADLALYKGKSEGKNRIILHHPI